MTYIRITASLRDEIIENALKQRFANERLALEEANQETNRLEAERDQYGYEAAFSKSDRERMAALPKGWLPTLYAVKVAIEETSDVIEVKFGDRRIVPFEAFESSGRYGNRVTNVIRADHPYLLAEQRVEAAKEKARGLYQELLGNERALRAKVKAVLDSTNSVSRLLEIWPEVTELLPDIHSGPKGGVPAVLIADLNAEIGLIGAE